MTAPDVVIFRTPAEATSATPPGTPVFVASGKPQADGLGRQVLPAEDGVRLAVGAAGGLAECVGFDGTVGRTVCEGVAGRLGVDDGGAPAVELLPDELAAELAAELAVELPAGLSVAGADEPGTDGPVRAVGEGANGDAADGC